MAGSWTAPRGCNRPCGGDAMCCGAVDAVLWMLVCSMWHRCPLASIDHGMPQPRPFGSPQRALCARLTSSHSASLLHAMPIWLPRFVTAASFCLRRCLRVASLLARRCSRFWHHSMSASIDHAVLLPIPHCQCSRWPQSRSSHSASVQSALRIWSCTLVNLQCGDGLAKEVRRALPGELRTGRGDAMPCSGRACVVLPACQKA